MMDLPVVPNSELRGVSSQAIFSSSNMDGSRKKAKGLEGWIWAENTNLVWTKR
jgi:hypothetical protein